MNLNNASSHDWDTALETFAAELTEAVYPVALGHGTGDSWVDLELDLWKALDQTVKKWGQQSARAC